jgi:hypothetical protein
MTISLGENQLANFAAREDRGTLYFLVMRSYCEVLIKHVLTLVSNNFLGCLIPNGEINHFVIWIDSPSYSKQHPDRTTFWTCWFIPNPSWLSHGRRQERRWHGAIPALVETVAAPWWELTHKTRAFKGSWWILSNKLRWNQLIHLIVIVITISYVDSYQLVITIVYILY